MIESHDFEGHHICLQLLELGTDQFRWVWKIDGVVCSKGHEIAPTREVAKCEALAEARRTIDRMDQLGGCPSPS